MQVRDLGTPSYRDAWTLQEQLHGEVLAGAEEKLLLLEHPPVITLGRRPGLSKNILAASDALQKLNVETIESDRGGDVTFHGPGQLVAYPIIRLNDHKLSVGAYVRALQQIVIDTLNDLGVPSRTDPSAIGVWTLPARPSGEGQGGGECPATFELATRQPATGESAACESAACESAACESATCESATRESATCESATCDLAKICAFGVRIRRGVSMHGLALNVTTDLSYFDLIVPCGISDRSVTSLQKILGDKTPTMQRVKDALIARVRCVFDAGRPHETAPPHLSLSPEGRG